MFDGRPDVVHGQAGGLAATPLLHYGLVCFHSAPRSQETFRFIESRSRLDHLGRDVRMGKGRLPQWDKL